MQRAAKQKALTLLREQLALIAELKRRHRDCKEFGKWWQKTRAILANLFGQDSPQLENFTSIHYSLMAFSSGKQDSAWQEAYVEGLGTAEAQLEALLAEVETFWEDATEPSPQRDSPVQAVERLCDRFHAVARQLRSRHDDREPLCIDDEYDVQDLLHGLLRVFFDDVRAEEWTPSYAGGSSRMDFILNQHSLVIEVKKSSPKLKAKDIGDQLLINIMRYKAHPAIKMLICFVYDPEGYLPNPTGLENDLSKPSDGIDIRCMIRPK